MSTPAPRDQAFDGAAEDSTLRLAIAIARVLRDPLLPSLVFLGCLVGAGFAVLALSWHGVAATRHVAVQMSYLVSGGFLGVALVGVGAFVVAALVERRDRAIARREMDRLVADISAIARGAAFRRTALRKG